MGVSHFPRFLRYGQAADSAKQETRRNTVALGTLDAEQGR